MKHFITALLLFTSSVLAAQPDSTRQPFYGDHVYTRFTFDVGITRIHPVATNAALFGSGGFEELMAMGVGDNFSIEPLNEKGLFGYDWTVSMHWYLADKRRVTDVHGNPYEYKLDGWELMTSSFGIDMFANRNFDLVVGGGCYWGNLKLYQKSFTDSTQKLYKNPFVAPMARAEVRLNFGFITIGGRFSYRYDITNDIWQRKSEGLDPIPGYRFRDIQYMLYIGIRGPFV